MNQEEEIEKLEETINDQPAEENFKDKYFRLLAESENMRKRMQKEKQEMIRFGIDNAIAEFLPTIDNFEQALRFADQAEGAVKNWAVGFQMILSQFKEVLHNHGITAFHSEGNSFDPAYHEAVEIVETQEYPEGVVLQEFTKGYKSPTRVIRPARVKVAKTPVENLEI
jgi:molecular chaperone GrpE